MVQIHSFSVDAESDFIFAGYDGSELLKKEIKNGEISYNFFGDVNALFGYNGCGKSSFTSMFKYVSKSSFINGDFKDELKDKGFKFKGIHLESYDGKILKKLKNNDLKNKVLVFDNVFVSKNIYIPSFLKAAGEKIVKQSMTEKLLIIGSKLGQEYDKLKQYEIKKKNYDSLKGYINKYFIYNNLISLFKEKGDIDEYIKNFIVSEKQRIAKRIVEIDGQSLLNKISKIKNKSSIDGIISQIEEKIDEYKYICEKNWRNIHNSLKKSQSLVKKINHYLDKLGFNNISIGKYDIDKGVYDEYFDTEPSKYYFTFNIYIYNNKVEISSLSEGEKKALGLALFFTLIDENKDKLNDKLVFFDDPVSSYDEKKRLKLAELIRDFFGIKFGKIELNCQLFVLTHDKLFLKFLRRYNSGIKLYLIDKTSYGSTLTSYNSKKVFDLFKSELKQVANLDQMDEGELLVLLYKLRYVIEYFIKETIFQENSEGIGNILKSMKNIKSKLENVLSFGGGSGLNEIYQFCSSAGLHHQDEIVHSYHLKDNIEKFYKILEKFKKMKI